MDELQWAAVNAAQGECDGACDEHHGAVKVVRVKHQQSGHDWGYFAYCDAAIDEDISRGLVVEVVNPTSSPNQPRSPCNSGEGK